MERIPVRRQEVIKETLKQMQAEQRTKDNAGKWRGLSPAVKFNSLYINELIGTIEVFGRRLW